MHKIQCKCGALHGRIEGKGVCNRVVCYCGDCRAFARYLGAADEVLDAHGGTEIIQVAQPRVVFLQGKEHLSAMRLSEKGLIRWYAACCHTPIGNTLSNPKISFIGLVHSFLEHSKLDEDFGKDIAIVNVSSASGDPKPKQKGLFGTILRFIWIVLPMRISGQYRGTPFFDAQGKAIVEPTVLTAEERKALKAE